MMIIMKNAIYEEFKLNPNHIAQILASCLHSKWFSTYYFVSISNLSGNDQ